MKQTHSTTKLLAAAIFELIIAIDLLFPAWLGWMYIWPAAARPCGAWES